MVFVSSEAIAPEMVALAGEEDSEPVMRTHGGDRRRTEEMEERRRWGRGGVNRRFLYPAFLPLIGVPPGEVI